MAAAFSTLFLLTVLLILLPGSWSEFVFATCKRGYEKLLKAELSSAYASELKIAFSRPGLITWKTEDATIVESFLRRQEPLTFARSTGKSVPCQITGASDIVAQARLLQSTQEPLCLHVFSREEEGGIKNEHPQAVIDRKIRVDELRKELLTLAPDLFGTDDTAKEGQRVLDVIVGDATEKLFLGEHIHTSEGGPSSTVTFARACTPWANNLLPKLSLPVESPSRAWLKIEEAIQSLDLEKHMQPGDTALEIGSAPGGCCYSLLQRGLQVCGVDPCPSDRTHAPIIKKNKNFHEIRAYLHAFKPQLAPAPKEVQWLLCDANIPPEECLQQLISISRHYAASRHNTRGFKGLLYTCKLNDRLFDMKPEFVLDYLHGVKMEILAANAESGDGDAIFSDVSMLTLPANRQEVLILARTRLLA